MLKRTGLLLAVLAALLALAATGCGGDDGEEETPAATATTGGGGGEPITVDLEEQNGSGETGTATLTPAGDGKITVKVELSNSPADPQPAHIHTGTCAQLGDVAFPLTNVEGGSSETEVSTSLDDLQAADFAINVHKSEADIGTYVACGDIPKS
jgi:ABC-type glycerol-3-phosphate transport system substrate-binding protein